MIKIEKKFQDACILTASVATNGFQGGDAGHGCRTEITLQMDGGDMEASFNDGKLKIVLSGDAELRTITEALSFMAMSLETITDEDTIISYNDKMIKAEYKEG